MMDLKDKVVEHPAQDETVIVTKIVAGYAQFGLIPMVLRPPSLLPPNPTQRIPVQRRTDLKYIQALAERHGYVFYISPGPAPATNTAYWGPPIRMGLPQKALAVNQGPDTNVKSISIRNNSLAPTTVYGRVQDRDTNVTMPIQTVSSTRPPLSLSPALRPGRANTREQYLQGAEGLSTTEAMARAQAQTDQSTDDVVTANGELDALSYGALLMPRALVEVQGVGLTYDGRYYVKSVTHTIQKGNYSQQFSLSSDGTGLM
jgi:hypothetical protein